MTNHATKDYVERVRVNQHKLSSELGTRFDYIVCGAGTSGCVLAARLALGTFEGGAEADREDDPEGGTLRLRRSLARRRRPGPSE